VQIRLGWVSDGELDDAPSLIARQTCGDGVGA